MKLRSHLLLLSIATAAPVVVLAIVVAVVVVKQERDTVRDAAGDRVIAVMSAIDAELKGSIATLRAAAGASASWRSPATGRPKTSAALMKPASMRTSPSRSRPSASSR